MTLPSVPSVPTGLSWLIWWGWWWHWSLFVYPGPFKHMSVLCNSCRPPELLPNMHWGLPCSAHWLISIHTITQQPLYTSVSLSTSERLAEIDKHWHGTVQAQGAGSTEPQHTHALIHTHTPSHTFVCPFLPSQAVIFTSSLHPSLDASLGAILLDNCEHKGAN